MPLLGQALKNSAARSVARAFGLQLRDRRQFVFDMLPLNSVGGLIGMYRPDVLRKLALSTRPHMMHLVDPLKKDYNLAQSASAKIASRRNLLNYCKEVMISKSVNIHDEPVDDVIHSIGHNVLDWVYINRAADDQVFGYDLTASAQMLRPGGLIIGDGYGAEHGHVKRVVDSFITSGALSVATINNRVFVLKKHRD